MFCLLIEVLVYDLSYFERESYVPLILTCFTLLTNPSGLVGSILNLKVRNVLVYGFESFLMIVHLKD